MISPDNILDNISGAAIWCSAGIEPTDLAQAASVAIEKRIPYMSVGTDSVSIVWAWLEGKQVKIFSRFYLKGQDSDQISILSAKINQAFKNGADGAQVFVAMRDIDAFVSQLYLIRDDLFFNKSLFFGIDINEIGPFEWQHLFGALKKMRASGLLLVLPKDNGDNSDYVGRVYAALNALTPEDDFEFHFLLGNNGNRIEQTARLFQAIRPDLSQKVKFFINYL